MPFTGLVSHRWKWLNVGAFLVLLVVSAALLRTGTLPLTFFPYLDDDIQLIRSSYDDLVSLSIRTPQGVYPLDEIADIHPTNTSLEVSRINGRRTIRVDADMADPSLSAPAILGDIEENIIPAI